MVDKKHLVPVAGHSSEEQAAARPRVGQSALLVVVAAVPVGEYHV